MVGHLGPNRHVAAGQPHTLLSDFDYDLPVHRLLDDGVPSAAAENVRHVVGTASPTESDTHGK
jgi:hypothetical protein